MHINHCVQSLLSQKLYDVLDLLEISIVENVRLDLRSLPENGELNKVESKSLQVSGVRTCQGIARIEAVYLREVRRFLIRNIDTPQDFVCAILISHGAGSVVHPESRKNALIFRSVILESCSASMTDLRSDLLDLAVLICRFFCRQILDSILSLDFLLECQRFLVGLVAPNCEQCNRYQGDRHPAAAFLSCHID